MSKKNSFLRFLIIVITPVTLLLAVLSVLIFFTLYKIKKDDLKAYKHVVIQRMAQYVESNFLGVNTLSITTQHIEEPKRREEIQQIFNIITVNAKYPYMGVLKKENPVVESFYKMKRGVHFNSSQWFPIQLKDTTNSFYRYFLLSDGRYIVELRKNLKDIATIAYVDFNPLFNLLTEEKANGKMELEVNFKDRPIFKSKGFSNSSIMVQDILFKDEQSQLVFHAQYNLINFFMDYKMIYIEIIGFILVSLLIVLISGYRSLGYLYGIVDLKNTSNKKEKVRALGDKLDGDIAVPSLVKGVVEALLKQDIQNDHLQNNQLNLFHNLKNISNNLATILKEINDVRDLDNSTFLLIKNEISRINIKSIEGEQKARAILNNVDETQASLIDLGIMALDHPIATGQSEIKTILNASDKFFYGRYISASKSDLSIIVDCLYENAVNATYSIVDPLKKEIEIKVFGEKGLSCLGVYNYLPDNTDLNKLITEIKMKIVDVNNRWTTKKGPVGGQGIRSIADLTLKNNGKVIVRSDNKGRFFIGVGFPQMTPPFWAIEELMFFKGDHIVAIDDDTFFTNKLKDFLNNESIKLEIFSSLDEGITKVKDLMALGVNVHLLCDQNFVNGLQTGIEAIQDNNLENISTLITSDTLSVEKLCSDNNISYLAKARFFTDFPVIYIDPSEIKFVNIDDDTLGASRSCLECKRFDVFVRISNRINQGIPVYMDYMLNADDVGFDDRLKWLKDNNFNNITLHSGSPEILKEQYGHLGHRILENKDNLWKEFEENYYVG